MKQQELKEILSYCPDTGVFTWLANRGFNKTSGKRAGSLCKTSGYRRIKIKGKTIYEHRLACIYMTGDTSFKDVDHINLDKSDNKWSNIRKVTRSQNCMNKDVGAYSTTGVKGVTWRKDLNKYLAKITLSGKVSYLGVFSEIEDARNAYNVAMAKLHGDYGRVC